MRKCLNNGFDRVSEICFFCNNCNGEMKRSIDVVTGGAWMEKKEKKRRREVASRIVNNMAMKITDS